MQITCHHSASSHGIPVILDDEGSLMDYGPGLTAILKQIDWSRKDLAKYLDVSPRTVERYWLYGSPPATVLNLIELILKKEAK